MPQARGLQGGVQQGLSIQVQLDQHRQALARTKLGTAHIRRVAGDFLGAEFAALALELSGVTEAQFDEGLAGLQLGVGRCV